MGLKVRTLSFLLDCVDKVYGSYDGLSMLELGNQTLRVPARVVGRKMILCDQLGKKKWRGFAKQYFQSLGFRHTSMDMNGYNGAVKIDLSRLVDPKWHNRFDVVTNFGTSEHVWARSFSGQYECFRNMHVCAKATGLIIHAVPLQGTYSGHCTYYYSFKFFKTMAADNAYKIVALVRLPMGKEHILIGAAFQKTSQAFSLDPARFRYVQEVNENEDAYPWMPSKTKVRREA